jgi:transcriptional regulator with XRE-family HTH domain
VWYKYIHEMTTHAKPNIALTVGVNLKAAREARRMTQKEVADAIGVTNRDVSRWENGGVEPGTKYRHALAQVLFDGDLSALYRVPARAA